jgi:hypothetical protein
LWLVGIVFRGSAALPLGGYFLLAAAVLTAGTLLVMWIAAIRDRKWAWVLLALAPIAFVVQFLLSRDDVDIAQTIETVATSSDPAFCDALVTDRYLRQTTGLEPPFADESCEQAASLPGPESVEVDDVDVEGDAATAVVTADGGSLDGSSVLVGLVNDDGEWKLDRRIEVERLDREGFETAYREELVRPEYGFSPDGADCAVAMTQRLSDSELERALLGEFEILDRLIVACDRQAVESLFIDVYDDPGYGQYPQPVVDCARLRLSELPGSALVDLMTDMVRLTELNLRCGRSLILGAYAGDLGAAGVEPPVVDCIVGRLRGYSAARWARATYDEDAFAALAVACGG